MSGSIQKKYFASYFFPVLKKFMARIRQINDCSNFKVLTMSFPTSKFHFNLRPYFYIFAARSKKNAGVAQLVRALDS